MPRAVFSPESLAALTLAATPIVKEAGAIALEFAERGAKSWLKNDASHVTEADLAVDRFLQEKLTALSAEIGWLSEESTDNPQRLEHNAVWIVDPIDGTRSFIEGVPVWVISVALVVDGDPAIALIYNPSRNELFEAQRARGARLNGTAFHAAPTTDIEGASVCGPAPMVSHLVKAGMTPAEWIHALAYRFANVASGRIDAALSRGQAKDWDIAAADLLLREAGGLLTDFDGNKPAYNRPTPVHPPLVASGTALAPALRDALASLSSTSVKR